MPIREFQCNECNNEFEKIVRASTDPASLSCPSCGSPQLKQKLSTFAAQVSSGAQSAAAPMACPSGGMCPQPGVCGMRN
jgi:putative FmdB family regulatory protein